MPEPEIEADDQETVVETPEVETEETEEEAKPEGEESAEDTEEGAEETPAPTRGERRQQRLANELRQEREARIRAETRAEEAARTRQPQTNPDEARRIEDEKLALMDPQERRDYMRDKEMRELRNGMAMTQFQMRDSMDRSGFENEIRGNAALEKMRGEVEKMHAEALKNGNFVPRLSLLDYVIGKQAREKLRQPPSKAAQAAKKAAGERVDSVKGKPMSGKSDVAGSKNDPDSLEALQARIAAEEKRRGLR